MPLDNRTCFLVNLRDRLSCRRCGKQPQQAENYHRGFEYHHLLPKSQGGPDTPENIILLCKSCHQTAHAQLHLVAQEGTHPPDCFTCRQCSHSLDSQTVTCNCGWYLCPHCLAKTHLYEHFWG